MAAKKLRTRNNHVDKLIQQNNLDEAERVLAEIEQVLARRPPPVVKIEDLEPAYDEYFYRCHRVSVGWRREAYAQALPHAERCYELENAIYRVAKEAGASSVSDFAFIAGAWGIVSMLTRCKRFEDADRMFGRIVADEDFFHARRNHDEARFDKLMIACLCIYFEREDDAWFSAGRKHVKRAQKLALPRGPELGNGYASYWARVGDAKRALDALEDSVSRGDDREKIFEDKDFTLLHGDPRWERLIVDRLFSWEIDSTPPGARIWIDGVDTGRVTPAKLRPPKKGMHEIRLVLAGHQDDTVQIEQSSRDMGLDMTRALVSHDYLAGKARMAEDGVTPPSQAARERTRAFIGERRRASATVRRDTTYGLGGVAIRVEGTGRVSIRKERWGEAKGFDVELELGGADTAAVFDAFIEQAFTEMVIAPHTGVPDELHYTIALLGDGGTHVLGKFLMTRHDRFMALSSAVATIAKKHLDAKTIERLTI